MNLQKEYWLSRGLYHQPPVLKSCTLPTKLWGLAKDPKEEDFAKHCGEEDKMVLNPKGPVWLSGKVFDL